MGISFKLCPICDARNHPRAVICNTCGASLKEVEITYPSSGSGNTQPQDYDFRYGETDLLESATASHINRSILIFMAVLALAGAFAAGVFVSGQGLPANPANPPGVGNEPADGTESQPSPTLNIATVTPGPPTATASPSPLPTETPTETPTPAPCVQRIVAGDSLLGAITRCGHRSRDVLPTVMALNNIQDAAFIREGQEIIIPWPTPTIDPDFVPEEEPTPEEQAAGEDEPFALVAIVDPFAPIATATLPPGIMWHQVQFGENIIAIAVAYEANAKVLSELNPEIDFARCEFGERFGGPECVVQLFEGQMLRVPAPTPTPTNTPTPDPNATATPTPTATFNVPNAVSPRDQAFFSSNQIITLRWVPSATLGVTEAYLVTVTNVTTGAVYSAMTRDIALIVPPEWQENTDSRFVYAWQIGIIDESQSQAVRNVTAPLTFIWQGKAEN